jgi:hypothetical protein
VQEVGDEQYYVISTPSLSKKNILSLLIAGTHLRGTMDMPLFYLKIPKLKLTDIQIQLICQTFIMVDHRLLVYTNLSS